MKKLLLISATIISTIFAQKPSDSLIISAQFGNLSAQEQLGIFYFDKAEKSSAGKDICRLSGSKRIQELEFYKYEALRWLHTAVDNGSSKAFYYLGNYFSSCCWGEENADSAFYYWKKGSDLGEKHSLKELSYLYLNGIGCKKDLKKAHILSWKAFLKGNFTTPLIWISKFLDIDEYIS